LILGSSGHNSRGVTAKQMDGAAPIFDWLLYEKYFPHNHISTFVQRIDPFFHKSDDDKCSFSVNVKL
jgi:hypothetical protein